MVNFKVEVKNMKIKEVEKVLQMNAQTIRYYEKLGFLCPSRDENGYRNYSLEDIKILKKIRFLRELDIPLELIGRILENPMEFQKILEQHIQILHTKVENLEDIQKRCEELNQRNIPLLDAVIDGEFQSEPETANQLKKLLKKTLQFMEPYPVITIGRKTTPYHLMKKGICALLIMLFIILSYMQFLMKIYNFKINWIYTVVMLVILYLTLIKIMFHEKYYEFRDIDFYIFDSQGKTFQSIKAILNNTTNQLAYHFKYSDIDKVKIIIEKKIGGLGFGVLKYFNIIYKFYMKDGKKFEINSSFYNKDDQDRKTIYEILDYHNVKIEDTQNLKKAIEQNEMSLFDYLDKYY